MPSSHEIESTASHQMTETQGLWLPQVSFLPVQPTMSEIMSHCKKTSAFTYLNFPPPFACMNVTVCVVYTVLV